MKKNILYVFLLVSTLITVSCNGDDEIVPPRYISKGIYDSGVLVLNRGSDGNQNASLSYLSFDLNNNVSDIYQVNNNVTLGSVAQSMFFYNDLAYIVVSGSNKIEIANRYTMKNQGSILIGLDNPKYMTIANGKIYVTNQAASNNLTDDYVSVYNLTSNAFVKNIATPNGSVDKLIGHNNKVYVIQGGTNGIGNQIVVLDAITDTLLTSITVGTSPNSLEIQNGNLIVLCGGNSNYTPTPTPLIPGKLLKIDLDTNIPTTLYNFPATTTGANPFSIYPNNLVLYGDELYFTISNGVYKIKITDATYTYSGLFQTTATNLLGFGIKANNVYIGDAKDFIQNGTILVYTLGSSNEPGSVGVLRKTINIGGLIPNGFYFNL